MKELTKRMKGGVRGLELNESSLEKSTITEGMLNETTTRSKLIEKRIERRNSLNQ